MSGMTALSRLLLVIAVTLGSGCSGCTESSNASTMGESTTANQQEAPQEAGIDSLVNAPLPDSVVNKIQAVVPVKSVKMKRVINNTVVVPKAYLAAGDETRYPVVYLLHGHGDVHSSWASRFDLKQAADQYGIIFVCPDGQNSWYFDSPVKNAAQFETYVSRELVAFIDAHYRTRADRQGRAITGLSMGGHGALWLAFRHPDVFGSCGSMSGGVDISKFPNRWNIQDALGRYESNKKVWESHSVISLVPSLQPGQLNIIIDDGRQDFFYDVNMALHASLDKQGIKHSFSIRPGQHSWTYWRESLPQHLAFFNCAFTGKPVECKTSIDNSPLNKGKGKATADTSRTKAAKAAAPVKPAAKADTTPGKK